MRPISAKPNSSPPTPSSSFRLKIHAPFVRLWLCAELGSRRYFASVPGPGHMGVGGLQRKPRRRAGATGQGGTQQRARALRRPPSLSGAAVCTPTLCWASVLPARTAACSLPTGPAQCGVLGPGQAPRPPGQAGDWECRWKPAPELSLHRPGTAVSCRRGAPHVRTGLPQTGPRPASLAWFSTS